MSFALTRVIIFCGDVKKCASFYRDVFEMTPTGEWSDEWAELRSQSCRLAFHQAYGEDGRITRPTGSRGNPHKIVFTVPDVEAARKLLIDRGAAMDEIHKLSEFDDLMICDGSDPEGHRFQICNR